MSTEKGRARAHAIISGFVQRVGYRQFAIHRARHLGLVGWVMNREDGTVELVAEGERGKLEQLISHLERGPAYARVEQVQVRWGHPEGELASFDVRFVE